ncbi:hypothetical protein PCE1_000685 [Barthelona sp. PCE]
MGNVLSTNSSRDYQLHHLDMTFDELLNNGRLFKSIRAYSSSNSHCIKVFFNDEKLDLAKFESLFLSTNDLLRDCRYIVRSMCHFSPAKALAYVYRPFSFTTLENYLAQNSDNVTEYEKHFFIYQIACVYNEALQISDIFINNSGKLSNFVLNSGHFVQLADFLPFKPVEYPSDNSAYFSYWVQDGQIAPERFIDEIKTSRMRINESHHSMDIFDMACSMYRVLKRQNLFDFGSLVRFKDTGTLPATDLRDDCPLESLIGRALSSDPSDRPSMDEFMHCALFTPEMRRVHWFLELISGVAIEIRIPVIFFFFELLIDDECDHDDWTTLSHVFDRAVGYTALQPLECPSDNFISTVNRFFGCGIELLVPLVTTSILPSVNTDLVVKALLLMRIFININCVCIQRDIIPLLLTLLECEDAGTVSAPLVVTTLRTLGLFLQRIAADSSATDIETLLLMIKTTLWPLCYTLVNHKDSHIRIVVLKAMEVVIEPIATLAQRAVTDVRVGFIKSTGRILSRMFEGVILDKSSRRFSPVLKQQMVGLFVSDGFQFFLSNEARETRFMDLITFLGVDEWILRLAFFRAIGALAKWLRSTRIRDCMFSALDQGILDANQHVVSAVLSSMRQLFEHCTAHRPPGLSNTKIQNTAASIACFLVHPNSLLRRNALSVFDAFFDLMDSADLCTFVVPVLAPVLKHPILVYQKQRLSLFVHPPVPSHVFVRFLDNQELSAAEREKYPYIDLFASIAGNYGRIVEERPIVDTIELRYREYSVKALSPPQSPIMMPFSPVSVVNVTQDSISERSETVLGTATSHSTKRPELKLTTDKPTLAAHQNLDERFKVYGNLIAHLEQKDMCTDSLVATSSFLVGCGTGLTFWRMNRFVKELSPLPEFIVERPDNDMINSACAYNGISGEMMAIATQKSIFTLSMGSLTEKTQYTCVRGDSNFKTVLPCVDGRTLLLVPSTGAVEVFDDRIVSSVGTVEIPPCLGCVTASDTSDDGYILVFGTNRGYIGLIDFRFMLLSAVFAHKLRLPVNAVSVTSGVHVGTGKGVFVSVRPGTMELFSLSDGRLLYSVHNCDRGTDDAGLTLLSKNSNRWIENTDIDSISSLSALLDAKDSSDIVCRLFNPSNSSRLLTGSRQGVVRMLDFNRISESRVLGLFDEKFVSIDGTRHAVQKGVCYDRFGNAVVQQMGLGVSPVSSGSQLPVKDIVGFRVAQHDYVAIAQGCGIIKLYK